jgi:hypothetical protein
MEQAGSAVKLLSRIREVPSSKVILIEALRGTSLSHQAYEGTGPSVRQLTFPS